MVWNKVTPFSQIVAIILFVGVFALGYYLGISSAGYHTEVQSVLQNTSAVVASARYECAGGKSIDARYLSEQGKNSVAITLSDSRELSLPQAMSASGARYANADESFVFWNKGNTAFIEEDGVTTFTDCASK